MLVSKLNTLPALSSKQVSAKPSASIGSPLSGPFTDEAAIDPAMLSNPQGIQAESASLHAANTAPTLDQRDADDKLIAAWFKLMKPPHDSGSTMFANKQKQDDPGRLPDPLYEPTKEHVPDSLKIITFNDLMRAFAPKKPHWKHYDDASTQFQVGSQEKD